MRVSEMAFSFDLKFSLRIWRARHIFHNGYGVSIIYGPDAFYDSTPDLYELAVLGQDGNLTYETPITDDVERGNASEIDVMIAAVEALERPMTSTLTAT